MAGESKDSDYHIIDKTSSCDGYEIKTSGIIIDYDGFMWVAGKNITSAGLVQSPDKCIIMTPALVQRTTMERIKKGAVAEDMAQQMKALCSRFYDDLLKAGFDPALYQHLFGPDAYLSRPPSAATSSVKPREYHSDMDQDQAPATSSDCCSLCREVNNSMVI
ncbi:uncharacterized protein LOC131004765 isoform X2 [Salvia miltiorrhiza]|uniref:uncharacterized protein LOC131004765 isoform X2 n=1 Tax=Salvia miltiorrhiza TaxID=226208 RepID=UPI0025AD47C1|nr:uncharacterized protein LOC131004765 isoform X2 [Salvia miltiorrhiza]